MFITNVAENIWSNWPIALYISRIAAAVISIVVHSLAHAGVAAAFGDDSPREANRLTLDPRRHVEGMTIFMAFFFGLGWERTMPIRPHRMRSSAKLGAFLAVVAGPLATLGLMLLGLAWLNALGTGPRFPSTELPNLAEFLTVFIRFNIGVLLINLLPIYPMDMYGLFRYILPHKAASGWQISARLGTYSLLAGFAALVFIPNPYYYQAIVPQILALLDAVLAW